MGPPDSQDVASARRLTPAERIFRSDTLIVRLSLAVLVFLAWWWLVRSGGSGGAMPAGGDAMGAMQGGQVWTSTYLVAAFGMWTFMMVAMMLPSAAPMILLYARFSRQLEFGTAYTLVFALCYLMIWALFSALAAVSQAALVSIAAASADALKLVDVRLVGLLLLLAGAYQLSPLKTACLDQCRSPLSFLMQGWRPGWKGATRLGIRHGLYCLGCCWALMLLLFAAGVMNLAWIAALTLIVVAEKLAPPNLRVRQILAALLLLGGVGLMIAAM